MRPFSGRSAVGLLFACLAAVGCENQYSADRVYGLRKDPVIKNGQELAAERPLPDRPGQLPAMNIKDLTEQADESHPYYRPDASKRNEFVTKDLVRDPGAIPAADRTTIEKFLEACFGRPRDPKVVVTDNEGNVDEAKTSAAATLLKLEPQRLAAGSIVYREHCLHCHGVTGDGRGPTGKWVNPHPRDFRSGLFKFTSVNRAEKPYLNAHREDLIRTIRMGVEGTAMPSFNLLTNEQIEDVTSYVTHLAIRGETEVRTIKGGFESGGGKLFVPDGVDLSEQMAKSLNFVVKAWRESQAPENKIHPVAMKFDANDPANADKLRESVQRGKKIFEDEKRKLCHSCHTNYGRQANYKADEWGTLSRPRNLTQGIFRGGRRDTDLYNRIHSGIIGSGMIPFAKDLSGDEIWDLVNFVRVVGYPEMRKKLDVDIPE